MSDLLYMIAAAGLLLSGLASAVRLIEWLIRSDPRVIAQTGRWAAVGLAILCAPLLLALLINEKWTAAMALGAVMLFAFAWYGPRVLQRMIRYRVAGDWRAPPAGNLAPVFDGGVDDPELVRRSVAVLEEYLRRSDGLSEDAARPRSIGVQRFGQALSLGHNGNAVDRGGGPMSKAEAFAILGLGADAAEADIRQAHQQLRDLLSQEHARSAYFVTKIDQARRLLLGEEDESLSSAQPCQSPSAPDCGHPDRNESRGPSTIAD
jgi:hypothetical protein